MRVLVLGAGAIGQWLGALLAQGGVQTLLVARSPHLEALQTEGLRLGSGQPRIPVRALGHLEELSASERSVDWLVLAVKTFSVEGALNDLQQAGIRPERVLAIQNGIGTDDQVVSAFGARKTFAGAVTRAVALTGPGRLAPGRRGGLAVAPLAAGSTPADLPARLEALGVPVVCHGDARALRWSKLLLNLVANASCAILDLPPSRVLRRSDLYCLEIRALREALRVMGRQGLPVLDLPGYPVRLLAWIAGRLPAWFSRPWLGPLMASGRGDKPPSLLLDLRAGRRLTEVDWLNGAVARQASEVGVPAPVNRCLARVLAGLAAGVISSEDFRGRPEALFEELASDPSGVGGRATEAVEAPSHERA